MYVGIINEVELNPKSLSLSLNIQDISHLELTKLSILYLFFRFTTAVWVIQVVHFTGELGFHQLAFNSKVQIAALNFTDVLIIKKPSLICLGSAGFLLDEAKMKAPQFLSAEFH